jgi:hypothetical protein
MRGPFISALPQSTHTITSPRPRPIKVLLTTNMLPRCQGLAVANGDAIERLDHSDAGIPMKPGSGLDSQHYRGCFFCWGARVIPGGLVVLSVRQRFPFRLTK